MNVCMLSTIHPADDIRIVKKEADTLSCAGHVVTVVARPPRADKLDPTAGQRSGVKSTPIDIPDVARWKRPFVMSFVACRLARKINPDVVHFHDPELIPLAFLLRQMIGCRIVYDAHEDLPADIYSKTWIPRWLKPIVSRATELVEKFTAPRFDAVVAATPAIASRLRRYGADVVLVQNFARPEEFPASALNRPRKQQAVYVGYISFNRGLVEMIGACSKVGLPIVLAGKADPKEAEWLKRQRSSGVDWRGKLNREEISKLLSESMVGLCLFHPEPNHLYAMPTKLFEYMAAGLPIITADLPRSREIVEQSGAGLIASDFTVDAVARQLALLISDSSLRQRMGEAGHRAMIEHFNWHNEAATLVELYARLPSKSTKA